MKPSIKVLAVLIGCLVLSACATAPELNRELVQQQKITSINLNQMDQNMNIDTSDNSATSAATGGLIGALVGGAIDSNANAKRKKALEPMLDMIDSLNVNMVFNNALEDSLERGGAFGESVAINTNFDGAVKESFLVPTLTPNVIMKADYSGVMVVLDASISQESAEKKQSQYNSTYTSEQILDSDLLSKREDNKQFWKDNQLLLREKIVDGLYDVSEQFVDDYNADQAL